MINIISLSILVFASLLMTGCEGRQNEPLTDGNILQVCKDQMIKLYILSYDRAPKYSFCSNDPSGSSHELKKVGENKYEILDCAQETERTEVIFGVRPRSYGPQTDYICIVEGDSRDNLKLVGFSLR